MITKMKVYLRLCFTPIEILEPWSRLGVHDDDVDGGGVGGCVALLALLKSNEARGFGQASFWKSLEN